MRISQLAKDRKNAKKVLTLEERNKKLTAFENEVYKKTVTALEEKLKKAKTELEAKKTVYETLGGNYKKNMESLLQKLTNKISALKCFAGR